MKKIMFFFVLFIVMIMTTLSVSTMVAYAEEAEDIVPKKETYSTKSNNLEGSEVRLEYHNYTMSMSGVYRAFVLTYDGAFAAQYYGTEAAITTSNLYSLPTAFFRAMGYQVLVDTENTSLVAYHNYASMTDLYLAMGIDGYDSSVSTAKKESSFLFVDYTTEQATVFSGIEEKGKTLNQLLDLLYTQGISRDKIQLNYTYGTPYKIISTDADSSGYSHEHGIYLHKFEMDMDSAGRVIVLRQHSPNAAGWYALAIFIAIGVAALPFTIYLIKRKKMRGGYGSAE